MKLFGSTQLKANALMMSLMIIVVIGFIASYGLKKATHFRESQKLKSSKSLNLIELTTRASTLRIKLLKELSTYLESWTGTGFSYSHHNVMSPHDFKDLNINYEIHCLQEGAADPNCFLENQEYPKNDDGGGQFIMLPKSGLRLPKTFQITIYQRNPTTKSIIRYQELVAVTPLTLNNYALVVTGQDSNIQLGPANYGSRISINFLEEGGPYQVNLNNYEPIDFSGPVTTSVEENLWNPMDPNGSAITYSDGISFNQGLDVDPNAIVSGFQELRKSPDTNLFGGEGDVENDSFSLEISSSGLVSIHDKENNLVWGPQVPSSDSSFYFGVPVTINNPTAASYKNSWSIISEDEIYLNGPLIASNPDEPIGIASTLKNIQVLETARSLLPGNPMLKDISTVEQISFQVDAAVIAPLGEALRLDPKLLVGSANQIGTLVTNGMIVTKKMPFYNVNDSSGTHGFTAKINNFNNALLNNDSSPPGLSLETNTLSMKVLERHSVKLSLSQARKILGID